MMKKIMGLFMLLIAAIGCSNEESKDVSKNVPSTSMTRVKVGDLRSEFWLPLYVAKEKRYFNEEGLEVELILFKDGPVALQSALSGDVDFAVLSTEPVLIAYEKGFKSTILMATLKNKPFMLISNKNINAIADLKGTTIAAGTPGSSPYAFILSILKKAGLDPNNDVALVNMDYGASLVALNKNQIQATFLDSTRINQSHLETINILVDTVDPQTHIAIYGTDKYEASLVLASQNFIKSHPETTQKFINAMIKAVEWQNDHSDEEIADLVKPYFSDLDMLDIIRLTRSSLSKDGRITEEGYNAMINFSLDEGLIKEKIPFEAIIDLQFVENAHHH